MTVSHASLSMHGWWASLPEADDDLPPDMSINAGIHAYAHIASEEIIARNHMGIVRDEQVIQSIKRHISLLKSPSKEQQNT